VLSDLPDAEIEARIKKLKAKKRERLMQGARAIERTAWTEPVIEVMEKVDPRSANVGSLTGRPARRRPARAAQLYTEAHAAPAAP